MILRRTARPKAGSHSARLWGLRNNHLNMLLDSENSSSLSPVLTVSLKGYYQHLVRHCQKPTYPVIMRKTPTPPIHPMRMCRGKKPMRAPSRKAPRRKNVKPVKTDEKAKAASVVAMTSCGRSSPISLARDVAIIWKNGCKVINAKQMKNEQYDLIIPPLRSSCCRWRLRNHFRRTNRLAGR